MKKFNFLGIITTIIFLCSCTFPYNFIENGQITDISQNISYYNICRMPFMGGSLLYNASNPTEGQLRNGVIVAIRQGQVYIKNNDVSNPIFSDKEDSAIYGYLEIHEITNSNIHFSFYSYQDIYSAPICKTFLLNINDEIDLNGDGCPDLRYKKSKFKRQGLKNSYTLDFISSQELLNTNMFSVIPEQYARNAYPMGLIGINPDGKFIVSLYENNSNTRSAVLGLKYGDYVFDSYNNNYKKILSRKSFRSARTIREDELEIVSEPNSVNFYFEESQFDYYGFSPKELYLKLCINGETENTNFIDNLNSLLKQTSLINQVYSIYNLDLPTEIEEVNLELLTTDELISLNRLFLSEYFPDYCPPVDFSNNDISDVFPILSLELPKEDISKPYTNRAISYNEYLSEKEKIENEMNSYMKFDFLNYYEKEKKLKIVAKIGLYGKYSISWSNLEGSIAAICFVQAETELNLKKTYSGSFLEKPIDFMNIKKDISIGYIPLSIGLTGNFDLKYNVATTLTVNSNIFAGYTGMYGGKITVGANYGTRWDKWFKIWKTWFYKPNIYINPYATGEIINKTAYYVGLQEDTTSLLNVNGNISAFVTPTATIIPKIGLCHNAVWMGISAENGVVLGFDFSSDLKKYSGNAYVDLYLKLNGKGGIDVTLPIINKGLNKDFVVFSTTPVNCRIAKWKVL